MVTDKLKRLTPISTTTFCFESMFTFLVQFNLLLLYFQQVAASSDNVHLELLSWGAPLMNQELVVPSPTAHTKPSFVLLLVNDSPSSSAAEKKKGRFSVRAPRGHGLMAVIQIVNLRESEERQVESSVFGGGGRCRDYLKLSDPSGLLSSPPICGSLKKEDRAFAPEQLVGPRVFHSAGGRIDVYYESDASDDTTTNQVVEIVFTGYTDCLVSEFSHQLKCGGKCISALLQCDEHVNCGFAEDFGVDEVNCTYSATRSTSSSASKPPYVVSLYLGAFLFVLILVAVAFYHRHFTYMRIKNIPT